MASRTYTFVNGQTADGGQVETEFNELFTNITNSNIASGAAIATTKLELGGSGSGSSTAIYLANNVAVTFLSNSGTSSILKQTTSNNVLLQIGTSTKSFFIQNSAGTNIFEVNSNSSYIGALRGYALKMLDSSDSNSGTIAVATDGDMNFELSLSGRGFDFAFNSNNHWMKIPIVAGDPVALANGMIWYNSTSSTFKCYQGGAIKTFTVV